MSTIRRAAAATAAALGAGLLATIAAPAARAQVKLEYRFPEGQTLTYKTTSKTHQILTLAGMEIPTDVDQVVVTSRSIGRRGADASLPVREKIDAIRAEMTLPGNMQVTYDSKDGKFEADNEQLEFLGDIYKLVNGLEYTVVLDGKDKVKAVEGAEKLQEKAEKLDPQVRDSLRSRFSAETLRSEFEEAIGNLPDVLARPGEPWERTITMEGGTGQTLVARKKFEYVGTEKKGDRELDKIAVKTIEMTLEDDPNSQAPSKVTKSELKVDSSDGTILFDREAGRIVSAREKVRVKGTLTVAAAGQEYAGEIDLTIETAQDLQPPAR